jgi:hypothetical protein
VSLVQAWLAAREPTPPAPLATALSALLSEHAPSASADGAAGGEEGALSDALTAHARARLEQALSRPGRERWNAYRLLEADALLTYACEAALEEADGDRFLRRILTIAGRPR